MSHSAIITGFVSFFIVLFLTPQFIRFAKRINLLAIDQNKKDKPKIATSGGLVLFTGIFSGLMVYIFFKTFFPEEGALVINKDSLTLLFAALTSIFIIMFVGFIDDLLRKSKYEFPGLRQWQKPLLTLVAAIPLMVVNAGTTLINLPFFGTVNFGLAYPLFLIPIMVVGASNMVNLLGGFNGMESGMAIVYIGTLGLFAFTNYRYLAALIALVTFMSLLAFYIYNKYPAKILPGDSLTYLLGAVIISIAVLGNIEKVALIISIPFIIEFILKSRSKLRAQSYGYYQDGKVKSYYKKIYSIPHLFTRTGKFTEKQVVYFMVFVELIFAVLIWFV